MDLRPTDGLHHVTAIAGDPERNAEFFVETLGLRLVKRTVNHDAPETYHLYYGDGEGTPGTCVTYFPWGADAREGTVGAGQPETTAYAIPPDTVDYWVDRLESAGVAVDGPFERFGETVLAFADPDGIGFELVETDAGRGVPWPDGPVTESHQLRGFHGVTLAVRDHEPTARVLTDILGYEFERSADGRYRYRAAGGGPGSVVDLVESGQGYGEVGTGTVHHVAFAAADEAHQDAIREALVEAGHRTSEPVDRAYFRSVYVREPGGVLFEVATTGPGFTVDEDLGALGSTLALPPWLEDEREAIEAALPPFDPPVIGAGE